MQIYWTQLWILIQMFQIVWFHVMKSRFRKHEWLNTIKFTTFFSRTLKSGEILFSKDLISNIEEKDERTQKLIRTYYVI